MSSSPERRRIGDESHPVETQRGVAVVYLSPLRWIRLATYCELSGDTADAVHARRRKRQWMDGLHCRLGPDGNLWINPEEVNKWVEGQHSTRSNLIARAV